MFQKLLSWITSTSFVFGLVGFAGLLFFGSDVKEYFNINAEIWANRGLIIGGLTLGPIMILVVAGAVGRVHRFIKGWTMYQPSTLQYSNITLREPNQLDQLLASQQNLRPGRSQTYTLGNEAIYRGAVAESNTQYIVSTQQLLKTMLPIAKQHYPDGQAVHLVTISLHGESRFAAAKMASRTRTPWLRIVAAGSAKDIESARQMTTDTLMSLTEAGFFPGNDLQLESDGLITTDPNACRVRCAGDRRGISNAMSLMFKRLQQAFDEFTKEKLAGNAAVAATTMAAAMAVDAHAGFVSGSNEDVLSINPATGLPMSGAVDSAGNPWGVGNPMDGTINPTTGLVMQGGIDSAGNPFGTDISNDHMSDYRSPGSGAGMVGSDFGNGFD